MSIILGINKSQGNLGGLKTKEFNGTLGRQEESERKEDGGQ